MRAATGLLVVLPALTVSVAGAEESTFSLRWVRGEGADDCPDGQAAAREVARRLARDPFRADEDRCIEVVVARGTTGGWLAQIFVRQRDGTKLGTRSLESSAEGCGPIFDATVLALTLTIDPEAAQAAPPPAADRFPDLEPSPPSPPVIRPEPRTPLPPPPTSACPPIEATGRGVELSGGALAVIGAGLLPEPSVGFGLLTVAHFREGLGLAGGMVALPSREVSYSGARLGAGLTAAWLEASFAPIRRSLWTLGASAGLSGGLLHVVAYSPEPDEPGDLPWAAVSLAIRGQVGLVGPLVGGVGVRGFLPLTRYELQVDDRAIFVAPTVGGTADLGVGLAFR
ncbi:MAG: hypothetical protein JW751_01695 [Polyangiaceae bacterium]|nr:hypothetical protein [Polyangiaceae bacterium]